MHHVSFVDSIVNITLHNVTVLCEPPQIIRIAVGCFDD